MPVQMDLRRQPASGNKLFSSDPSSGSSCASFSINSLLSHKQQAGGNPHTRRSLNNTRGNASNAMFSAEEGNSAFPFPAMPFFGPQMLAGMALPEAGGPLHQALIFNVMAMASQQQSAMMPPAPPQLPAAAMKYPKRHSLESIFHRRQQQRREKSPSLEEGDSQPPKLQPSSPRSDSTGVRVEGLGEPKSDLPARAKSASPGSPPSKSTPHSPASSVVSSDSSSICPEKESPAVDLPARVRERSKEEQTDVKAQEQQWLANMNHYVHLANQMLAHQQQQQGQGQPLGVAQAAAAMGMSMSGAAANSARGLNQATMPNGLINGSWDQRFAPPWLFGGQPTAAHHSQQPQLHPLAHLAQLHHPHHHHHHHKGGQQKRKGGQIRFTNEQTDTLESTFDAHKYLSNSQRKKLAKSLALSERQVKTWFQNRRAKWRRIRKDGEDEEDLSIHGGFHHHHAAALANPPHPLSAVTSAAQSAMNPALTSVAIGVEHSQQQPHHRQHPSSTSSQQSMRNATGTNNHPSAASAGFRNFFSPPSVIDNPSWDVG